jgi:hypothetical protein
MSILSIFKNKINPSHCEPLPTIIHKIRSGFCAVEINSLRQHIQTGNEIAAKQVMRTLLRFTPGGHFRGERTRETIVTYSGLAMLETAYLPADLLMEYKTIIEADTFTRACFLGPEGDSLRILIQVNSTIDAHSEAHQQVRDYYEQTLSIAILNTGRQATALCPFSFDPDAYFNPDSTAFVVASSQSKPKTKRTSNASQIVSA